MKKLLSVLVISASLWATETDHVTPFEKLVEGQKSTQDAFKKELENHDIVVIKCSMIGCPPCKAIAPKFQGIARTHSDKVRFLSLDVTKYGEVVDQYKVRSVPAFLIFSKSKFVKMFTGAKSLNEVTQLIEQLSKKQAEAA